MLWITMFMRLLKQSRDVLIHIVAKKCIIVNRWA